MKWPWDRMREEREAERRAEQKLVEAEQAGEVSEKLTRESRQLRARNGFGDAILRTFGGKT